MPRRTKAEREEALDRLREWVKRDATVYTVLRHVSGSGMSRSISLIVIESNEPRWLSYNVAEALDRPYDDRREAVKIGGCGMDMGFALVYDLSVALFGDGYALSQRWL